MSILRNVILNISAGIEQILPAQPCVLCGSMSRDGLWCMACDHALPYLDAAHCPTCALPTPTGEICGQCLKHPPLFARTTAVFGYAFPLDKLVQAMKYGEQLALAHAFAEKLAYRIDNSNSISKVKQACPERSRRVAGYEPSRRGGDAPARGMPCGDLMLCIDRYAKRTAQTVQRARQGVSEEANTVSPMKWDWMPDYVIPMPLHPAKLRERGFNQSQLLAAKTARELGIELLPHACRRVRNTPPQSALPWKERKKNVRDAFCCDTDLTGRRVALVDDVLTTGASLNALADAVRKRGATEISAWVVARTLKTKD